MKSNSGAHFRIKISCKISPCVTCWLKAHDFFCKTAPDPFNSCLSGLQSQPREHLITTTIPHNSLSYLARNVCLAHSLRQITADIPLGSGAGRTWRQDGFLTRDLWYVSCACLSTHQCARLKSLQFTLVSLRWDFCLRPFCSLSHSLVTIYTVSTTQKYIIFKKKMLLHSWKKWEALPQPLCSHRYVLAGADK